MRLLENQHTNDQWKNIKKSESSEFVLSVTHVYDTSSLFPWNQHKIDNVFWHITEIRSMFCFRISWKFQAITIDFRREVVEPIYPLFLVYENSTDIFRFTLHITFFMTSRPCSGFNYVSIKMLSFKNNSQ